MRAAATSPRRSPSPPWKAAERGRRSRPASIRPRKKEARDAAAHLARRQLPAARVADRPREARRPLPAARARARSCGASPSPTSPRRRTTPRCWRSRRRRRPGSTSSPTARSGARATPTASPPRSKASTSTTRAPRSTAPGHPNPVPRIVGQIRRKHAVEVEDLKFLSATPRARSRSPCPGPFTMAQQAQNDFYPTTTRRAMDYAVAVNEEIRDLFAAGADIVQIDEPYMQARPEKARAVRPEGAQPRARRHHRHDRGAHLLRLRRDHPRAAVAATRSCPSSPAARCRQVSIETAQSNLDCVGARAQLEGKKIMVGVHRPRRHDGRDARDRRRAHPPRAALRRRGATSSSRPTAA